MVKQITNYKFKTDQARALVRYVHKKYGREMEFLWARTPENGVWRRGDNEKWFGIIMTVGRNKIVPDADASPIEILDLRMPPLMIDMIMDKKMVFPGYHMNKRHWITIILDGRMDLAQIQSLLDNSYVLAGAK